MGIDLNEFKRKRNVNHFTNSRRRLKEKLVEYKGGKCEICGYNKCISALEFHHLDPLQKEFNINGDYKSIERAKKEVDKCILVCANCHREIHYEEDLKHQKENLKDEKAAFIEFMKNREKYKEIGLTRVKDSYKYLAETDILKDIEDGKSREEIFKKYCINNRTFNKFLQEQGIKYYRKKIVEIKPTKEELIELLKMHSKSAVGRMFDVSCNAVIKWCKKYNI